MGYGAGKDASRTIAYYEPFCSPTIALPVAGVALEAIGVQSVQMALPGGKGRAAEPGVESGTSHDGLALTHLPHAGLRLNDRGSYALIDPVLQGLAGWMKNFTPIVSGLDRMPPPDHVLITHGHYDHLDNKTLARLDKGTHLITPWGYDLARLLEQIKEITALASQVALAGGRIDKEPAAS